MNALYDKDFYSWAMSQGDALRRRSANEIDWDNLAEELETLGRSEANELRSRYAVLLAHLLKWVAQPSGRGASWQTTIRHQREDVKDVLADNPGLRPRCEDLFAKAYGKACRIAEEETGLPPETFAKTNPFTLAQAMDESFWPEG